MSINLNEFTREQLEFYIEVFKEAIDDANYHIQTLWNLPDGDTKNDLSILYEQKFNDAIMMRVQLENALDEVKSKEKELSN